MGLKPPVRSERDFISCLDKKVIGGTPSSEMNGGALILRYLYMVLVKCRKYCMGIDINIDKAATTVNCRGHDLCVFSHM